MISPTLVKSAFYKALMATNNGNLPEYLPYGVEGQLPKPFDVTDSPPKTKADLIDNRARLVIETTGNGISPDSDTYGTIVIRFTAYALANADAGFLAETIWGWLATIKTSDMPMICQSLSHIVRNSNPVTRYMSRYDLSASTFLATVHLHVPE